MAATPEGAPRRARGTAHAELIARAEIVGLGWAHRRWGMDEYAVRGETRRGCCVHLTVERHGVLLARWRYELDGRIVDDHDARRRGPGSSWEGALPALTEQGDRGGSSRRTRENGRACP